MSPAGQILFAVFGIALIAVIGAARSEPARGKRLEPDEDDDEGLLHDGD